MLCFVDADYYDDVIVRGVIDAIPDARANVNIWPDINLKDRY